MSRFTRRIAYCFATLSIAAFAAPSFAAPSVADIKTGADLVAACEASLGKDGSAEGAISATACNQYLTGMVTAAYNAAEPGMPTRLYRLGADGTDSVCFRLPELLKYSEFAALVVDYSKAHAGYGEQPAIEVAGRSLADKYPCKE